MDDAQRLQIFRGADAPGLMEAGVMTLAPSTPTQRAGLTKMMGAGMLDGEVVKLLVNLPGFSLTHVWFKKDYPLPLHSHDTDCLYYIVAGEVQLGTETLGAGDSFFVPANAAYAYRPGEEGVELLEFRHATEFDFRNLAKTEAFYDKATATIETNREHWRNAKRPAERSSIDA